MRAGHKKIKILVLHNGGRGPESESESGRASEAAHLHDLAEALAEHGFEVSVADAEDDPSRISHAVVVEQPDLIFNLVHQFRGDTLLNPNVASLLELHGLPHTGSDPLCLSTCQDRVRTHLLLGDAGVPVTDYAVIRDINSIPDTSGIAPPLALSHAFDDIYDEPTLRVLVHTRSELEEKARELAAGAELPLLAERFHRGRRIQAVVLGNRALEVLPLTERPIDPTGHLGSARVAQLEPDVADLIRSLAQRAFRVMDCRDCAQVDLVLDDEGAPQVLDVRPAFDTFPGSPFVVGARASALGLDGALALMAEIALERVPAREPAPAAQATGPAPDSAPAEAAGGGADEEEHEEDAEEEEEEEEEEGAGGGADGPGDEAAEAAAPRSAEETGAGVPIEPRVQLRAPPRRPASRGRPRTRLTTEPGVPLVDAAPSPEPPRGAAGPPEATSEPPPGEEERAKETEPRATKTAKTAPSAAKTAKAPSAAKTAKTTTKAPRAAKTAPSAAKTAKTAKKAKKAPSAAKTAKTAKTAPSAAKTAKTAKTAPSAAKAAEARAKTRAARTSSATKAAAPGKKRPGDRGGRRRS